MTHEVYEWIDGMLDERLLEAIPATPGQIDQYLAVAQQDSSMPIETSTAATTIKAFLAATRAGWTWRRQRRGTSTSCPRPAPAVPGRDEPGTGGRRAFYMTNTVPPEVQAAAWEFMKYMQTVDGQVGWHLVGSYLPTTQAAASDPRVTASGRRIWPARS